VTKNVPSGLPGNVALRRAMMQAGLSVQELASALLVDPKTVQRWVSQGRTPHRATAGQAANILKVKPGELWPSLDLAAEASHTEEVVGHYPQRALIPKHFWLDLVAQATSSIDIISYAAIHLLEDNPGVQVLLREKAAEGIQVRIAIGDSDSAAVKLRASEEEMPEGILGRVRLATSYYQKLQEASNIEVRLHATTLYNSLYRFDDQLFVNHHIYGLHGYLAPVIHLRQHESGTLFDAYLQSIERVWCAARTLTRG
jgi:transcriptional regulator with XRE-family HTH domain